MKSLFKQNKLKQRRVHTFSVGRIFRLVILAVVVRLVLVVVMIHGVRLVVVSWMLCIVLVRVARIIGGAGGLHSAARSQKAEDKDHNTRHGVTWRLHN